jgi:hypothetical protein
MQNLFNINNEEITKKEIIRDNKLIGYRLYKNNGNTFIGYEWVIK